MDRRLATILALDAAGFSSMMERDEEGTLDALKHFRSVIDPKIAASSGRIFGSAGDSVIAEFSSPVAAVRCATELQEVLSKTNSKMPAERQMKFRIGIHTGDIMVDGDNLMGDGVNVAARLEQLAPKGGVCISNAVADLALEKVEAEYAFKGGHRLKNISKTVGVWVWPAHHATSQIGRKRQIQRIALASVCALLIVVSLAAWLFNSTDVAPEDDLPLLAVMPFSDRSPGPDQGYLSDAISDGITAELAKFIPFRTVARNSSFALRRKDADVNEIREALGVSYILEGSQQKIGEHLIVSAKLLDANSMTYIWTESFEGEVGQLFEFQSEIIRKVASTVGGKLAVYPGLTGDRQTVSAIHLAAKGLKYLRAGDQENARQSYEAAIEADPTSVAGYNGLGFYYRNVANRADSSEEREELATKAREMANKALKLDPENYLTHYLLGHLYLLDGDVAQAEAQYDKAKTLNPSFSNVFVGASTVQIYLGEADQAIADIKHAMKIDPLHPQWFHGQLAWAYWASGDCAAAKDAYLPMTRVSATAHKTKAAILACAGDIEGARDAMKIFLEAHPSATLEDERDRLQELWASPAELDRWLNDLSAAGLPA